MKRCREELNKAHVSGPAGFTLVELLIVIAILAIVVGIAIPSYENYVVRANRAEATVELMNAAQALERCYSRFSAYNHPQCAVATLLAGDGISSDGGHYTITRRGGGGLTATAFELQAVPQGNQATRDQECATFFLTHTGQRSVSNTETPVDRCWRR